MSLQDATRAALAQWSGRTVAGMDLPTVMVAIAGAESGWQSDAAGDSVPPDQTEQLRRSTCQGYRSWGLWQVNTAAHPVLLAQLTGSTDPCVWRDWLSSPRGASLAAGAVIGNAAQDLPLSALRPWTVWWSPDGDPRHDAGNGNGIYRRHLAEAEAAVTEMLRQAPADDPGLVVLSGPTAATHLAPTAALAALAASGILLGAWVLWRSRP